MLRKMGVLVVMIGLLLLGLHGVSAQDAPVFVLVHGAFQDETGWSGVKAALEAQGATVITVQNAGRGADSTPLGEITLETYRDSVVAAIEAQDAPVVLVGHSFGGMIVAAVSEAIPDRVQTAVYLAAYLPADGDSLTSLASQDHFSQLGVEGNFLFAEDFSYGYVNPDVFTAAFCPDCDSDQAAVVEASQINEPLAPLNQPIALTDAGFGSVARAYILTAEDIVVSPQLQALMLSRTPAARVFAVNAGHAAYVTVPDALAAILLDIAG